MDGSQHPAEHRLNEDQSDVIQQTEDCCHASQVLSPEQ